MGLWYEIWDWDRLSWINYKITLFLFSMFEPQKWARVRNMVCAQVGPKPKIEHGLASPQGPTLQSRGFSPFLIPAPPQK